MNLMIAARTSLSVVTMSLVSILDKELLDRFEVAKKLGLEDFHYPILLIFILITGVVITPVFLLFYDKFLWKQVLFRKFNISGIWHYVNSYTEDDKRKNTSGYIVIEQSPFRISYFDGVSDKTSEAENYKARVHSTAGQFNLDVGQVIFAYNVSRIDDDGVTYIDKRSIEELKITRWGFLKTPVEMRGNFWNCLRTYGEGAQLGNNVNFKSWGPAVGQSVYTKSTKKEMRAATHRTL